MAYSRGIVLWKLHQCPEEKPIKATQLESGIPKVIQEYRKANTIIKLKIFGTNDATCRSNIASAKTGLNKLKDALKYFDYTIELSQILLLLRLTKH